MVWVGLTQSLDGVKSKDRGCHEKREFRLSVQPADFGLKTVISPLSGVSCLLAGLTDFRFAELHNCMSRFLKISSIFLSHWLVVFWRALTDTRLLSCLLCHRVP